MKQYTKIEYICCWSCGGSITIKVVGEQEIIDKGDICPICEEINCHICFTKCRYCNLKMCNECVDNHEKKCRIIELEKEQKTLDNFTRGEI